MVPADPRGDYDEYPQLVTGARASGPPDAIVRYCPRNNDVDFDMTFYILPAAPQFPVCTWCHHHKISKTSLASSFQQVTLKGVRCLFHEPRITKRLWPEAVHTSNLLDVVAYMQKRPGLPECKGKAGAQQSDNMKWFKPLYNEIPNFVACEACYEGIILGTAFADRFGPQTTPQGPADKWVCSMSYDFIVKAILRHSVSPEPQYSWPALVRDATKRLGLPVCTQESMVASKQAWVRFRQRQDIRYCETCFMDEIALTPFGAAFEYADSSAGPNKWQMWQCNANSRATREVNYVYGAQKRSVEDYTQHFAAVVAEPLCQGSVKGGKWHNLAEGQVDNFNVCHACYLGIFVTNGLGPVLSSMPLSAGPDTQKVCDMDPTSPNWKKHVFRFIEASLTGVWASYEQSVRMASSKTT
jgi:hypothetical protein